MNIVIPTIDYPPIEGGIGTLTLHLARELAALGHEVTVIAPRLDDMAEFDASEPVRIVRFGGYSIGWFRFFPLLAATRPFLRDADVVLGVNIAYGGVIGRLSKKRYLVFAYGYEFLKFRRAPMASALLRRVYESAAQIVAISSYTREQLIEFGARADRIDIIHPGAPEPLSVSNDAITTLRRTQVLGDGPIVLSVGRLIPRKNHVKLIEAMPAILAKHPDTMLLIAGRGPSVSAISRRANQLDVREHVALPGKVSDQELAAMYAACSIFALPCKDTGDGHVEGFGLVFAEANAYGKPVVAGRSGGAVDAVADGETGVLVEPDDADAIAEAIVTLLDDPDRAAAMGAAGKARVEDELNWRVFAQRVAELAEAS